MRIGFCGAGRWGMTLGNLLARKGSEVTMWEHNPGRLAALLGTRQVPDLPDTVRIPDSLRLTASLSEALAGADIVVLALPAQHLRENLAPAKAALTGIPVVVSVMKGIELGSHRRMSEIIRQSLTRTRVAVLTGPGIPYDVARGDPTSLLVAADDEATARIVRDAFAFENLRVYSGTDMVGAELGGALKNVIALAAGVADGLGLGINAKAALLTRGLAEMTRLGISLGANPLTFAGLSGVGDLIVTCFSPLSRNHQFGRAIAQGRPATEVEASLSGVAEGYHTCLAACELASRSSVEMPITRELRRILFESSDPRESIQRLLARNLKSEI